MGRRVTTVRLPYLKRVKNRWYFRTVNGGKHLYVPVPSPSSPDFAEAYHRLRVQHDRGPTSSRPTPCAGTFDALINEFRGSPDYRKDIAASTRANYDRYLEIFSRRFGDKRVATLTTATVIRLRDEMQDAPGKANNFLKVLRSLLSFGTQRGYCTTNAAMGVKLLSLGEHAPWPEQVILAALSEASSMLQLAIVTGLYSGQRVGDCIRIRHDQFEADMLPLVQQKTKRQVYVPVHPAWRSAIDAVPARAATILYDRHRRPFASPEPIQSALRALMKRIGFPGYTFHGLRKNAANFLAELGLSPHQIGSIAGMSIETVVHYTKGLETRRVSQSVASKIQSAKLIGNDRKW